MKIPRQLPLKQIRKQCLDCCGGSTKTTRFCASTQCPFWYLRFGRFPKTVIKTKGKEWEQLFDKENFKIRAKFSPDIEVEEYKL